MNVTFQSWIQAVWLSLIEPADMARKVVSMRFDTQTLWTAMALTAIIQVLLFALLQMIAPTPVVLEGQVIEVTPFAYTAMIGMFLTLFVYGTFIGGKMLDGQGTLLGTLHLLVWFQIVNLTLDVIKLVLILVSPAIGALFGMMAAGGLLWCIVNFVNVLHGFQHLGKSILALILALIGTAFISGIVVIIFGLVPTGATL